MTYKFTPGTYLTRDGRKAVVLVDDAPGDCPLIGWVPSKYDDLGAVVLKWTSDGAPGNGGPDVGLVAPVTEPEQVWWVCKFRSKASDYEWVSPFQHKTPAEAQEYAKNFDAQLIAILPAESAPSVFEDENTPSFAEVAALIERMPYHDGRDWLRVAMASLKRSAP